MKCDLKILNLTAFLMQIIWGPFYLHGLFMNSITLKHSPTEMSHFGFNVKVMNSQGRGCSVRILWITFSMQNLRCAFCVDWCTQYRYLEITEFRCVNEVSLNCKFRKCYAASKSYWMVKFTWIKAMLQDYMNIMSYEQKSCT